MHLGDVIKKYRDTHGKMSMQTFADKCGLSKGYIAMLERNVNSKTGEPVVPSIETFTKVAVAMGLTLTELMSTVDENQPVSLYTDHIKLAIDDTFTDNVRALNRQAHLELHVPGKDVKVPVYGCIPAGIPFEAINCIEGYVDVPSEWLASGDEYFGLKVKGDSMSPKYLDGDLIILRRQPDCESGQDAAVRINGDEATLKKVVKLQDGIMLQPLNPEYTPRMYDYNDELNPVEIMGVVVQLRRDI